jgi:hypothetical protein
LHLTERGRQRRRCRGTTLLPQQAGRRACAPPIHTVSSCPRRKSVVPMAEISSRDQLSINATVRPRRATLLRPSKTAAFGSRKARQEFPSHGPEGHRIAVSLDFIASKAWVSTHRLPSSARRRDCFQWQREAPTKSMFTAAATSKNLLQSDFVRSVLIHRAPALLNRWSR